MKRNRALRRRLRRAAIAIAVSSCFAVPVVLANPTGASVASGQVGFHQQGNLLQITNSPNAIINWRSFSIGANELTRFVQQSASSAVLNRVVGQDPSAILGALQSNGRVVLINPNGIVFGAGAQVDVAGLVASSLNLSDTDFLGGKLKFSDTPGAGSVVNEGAITTPSGGQVYLVGASVENKGLIRSPQGEVVLAAGKSVELVDPGTPNLRVEITAPDNQAVNLGEVAAESGRVGIYAGLVRQGGTIQANSAQVTADGRVVLKATQNATLEAGSVTSANGPSGGSVTVASGDTTLVAGTIEAKGTAGEGGRIEVLGNKVGLMGSTRIDASGESGGGTVLVGGDFQGKNPEVANAYRTYVGSEAAIAANAVTNGDGGKVVVWSDDSTRAYGTISARGGSQAGDGGLVEVSSKKALDFAARVDASAPNGTAGTLLLDPANVEVASGGVAGTTDVDAFADPGGTQTIDPGTLDAAGATVVLQATNDITVSDPVNLTTADAGFVAQAGNDINVDATIKTNGGDIHLEADSPHAPAGGGDGSGQVRIDAAISNRGNGATAGSITLIGGGDSNGGGFDIRDDVLAGTDGIAISLSTGGMLDLGIGAPGASQLSSKDIAHLKSNGPLVIGQATTAGENGSGLRPIDLMVNSIINNTAGQIPLSSESGTSIQLVAGGGGVTLERPITAYQDVMIATTGTVSLNNTIDTTPNSANVTIEGKLAAGPNGSIKVGTGVCYVEGGACPASSGSAAPPSSPEEMIPEDQQRAENVVVASTEQAITPPVQVTASASTPEEDEQKEKEKDSNSPKKPICTGSNKGQAGTSVAIGAGFARRCTGQGCS